MNITLQQRVYVRGELRDEEYRVTLQKSLLSLGLSEIFDMLGRVMNSERLQEVSFQQESWALDIPCVHLGSLQGCDTRAVQVQSLAGCFVI